MSGFGGLPPTTATPQTDNDTTNGHTTNTPIAHTGKGSGDTEGVLTDIKEAKDKIGDGFEGCQPTEASIIHLQCVVYHSQGYHDQSNYGHGSLQLLLLLCQQTHLIDRYA